MIICLLIPLGAASASDINTTDDQVLSATPNTDTLSAGVNLEQENDTLSVQNDENLLSAGQDSGSNESILKLSNDNLLKDDGTEALDFNSLNSVIRLSTDGYPLLTDYYYNNQPIVISKSNFVLDGNNHILNGNGNTVFQITGNNVTLKNLNIINSKVNTWDGNNGRLINVNITNCTISSGSGVITWNGNNGTMKKVTFENVRHTNGGTSDASCAYFAGVDYLVEDSKVINSYNNNARGLWLFDVTAVGNNIVKNCSYENISSHSWIGPALLFARGVLCSIINFTSKNVFNSKNSYSIVLLGTGDMKVYNSTFYLNPGVSENIGDEAIYGASAIYNCTFIGNKLPYACENVVSTLIVDNCTFDGTKALKLLPAYNFISNSTFKNIQLGTNNKLFTYQSNTPGFYQVVNCTFDNITCADGSIINVDKGNNYVFNKLTFKNNTASDYLLNINENITANVYTDTFKYSNNNVKDNINFTGEGFTPKDTLYVSDTPTDGDGTSRDKSISLTDALNNIAYHGKIIIINGTHTIDKSMTLNCNITGEKNVIINLNNFALSLDNSISLSNLTLVNSTVINVGSYNKISNINLSKNQTANSIFYFMGKFDVELNNILIFNSNVGSFFTFTNSRNIPIAPRVTVNGLKLDNVKSSQYIISTGAISNSQFNNIEVSNSQIKGIFEKSTNIVEGHDLNSVDSSFNGVTVKNSNITKFLFDVGNTLDNDLEYNNIVVDTVNATSSTTSFMYFRYNQVVNGLNIKNINFTTPSGSSLSKDWIINLGIGGNTINNFEIHGLNDTRILFGNGATLNTLNNIIVDKVNVTQLTGNVSNLNVIGLHVHDSNFTSGTIMKLLDSSIIQDSEFDTYTGHIVVEGDNVRISGSNFTGGNNAGLNGSAIYLINGSDQFKLTNCKFEDNIASNGTVYVSADCQRPQLNDCTFNRNVAQYLGGAVYIVSNSTDPVTVGINTFTNNTIYYPGQSRYQREGYNDFYGFLADVYSVLYLINDTGGKSGSDADGKSHSTPSSNLQLLNNLLDGSVVYFVRYGDTFTPAVPDYNYDSSFSDVTFYGNGTTLVHMGFTASTNSNIKVYNITFKDYPFTAVTVNASGCLFENCSFINVGGDNVLYGGAMQINANDTVIKNSRFIDNKATHVNTEGSGDSYGGALYVNASNIDVINCHFEGNNVSCDGAHIFIASGQDDVVLTGNNFTKSNVVGEGSGSSVVVQGTNMKIQDNNFTKNNGKQGAALSVIGDNSFLTISDNDFVDNTASLNGGALYLHFINSMATPNIIMNNNFTYNTAEYGGALYVDSSNYIGLTLINNCTNNTAVYDGGAVYINSPGFELADVTIKNNTAVYGGGVYVNAAGVTIRNVDFIGNNASMYGGALYVNALNTNVVGSDFIANNANETESMGSAVYVSADGGVTLTNVKLDQNYVFGRNSTYQRGDIFVNGGKFADNGITYGNNPYKQYLSNQSILKLTIAYVSENGGGSGTAYDSPATLTEVLKLLEPNSIIYLVGDDLTFNNYNLNNLTNVTIVNYNDGKNRKITGNNKYLFNHPKKIKNLSLNNYLSTKTQKNKN